MTVDEYRREQERLNALTDAKLRAFDKQRRDRAEADVLTELAASGR